jgi:dTDP-D-glucose 4,6-dehydratase
MKKVIVTGGLGFIGINLIKLLNKNKFFVINIDKISYSSNKNAAFAAIRSENRDLALFGADVFKSITFFS